jgi:pimeloyl-ACP methyl ester carboxylesterase
MAYWLWQPKTKATPNVQTVVCAHGLTRNGRDFDVIASRLAYEGFRVIAPDFIGRGKSDFTDKALYANDVYANDVLQLLGHLKISSVCWIGVSMGGLIGIGLASLPASVIKRFVLVDIGGCVAKEGLMRIKGYVGKDPRFASFAEGEQALAKMMSSFGEHTESEFRILSRNYIIPSKEPAGGWKLHYDPLIAAPFQTIEEKDIEIWALYDKIPAPILVVRGKESDLLRAADAARMQKQGAELFEFEHTGHAPTLIARHQVEPVVAWLLRSAEK